MGTTGQKVSRERKELTRRMYIKCEILYLISAAIMWKEYHWRKQRIFRRFATTNALWNELTSGENEDISILQMLEKETGIELSLENAKSYHEYVFLDLGCWNGRKLTPMQELAMIQQQDKWMYTQLECAILLSLHRDEKWGFDRLSKFAMMLDNERRRMTDYKGNDLKRHLKYARELVERVTNIPASEWIINGVSG